MYDIGIIGAGPAGYTAAIRAAQYGLKVVLFEKDAIGGTCLNRGCIPTKALLHSTDLFAELKTAYKCGITAENISFDYAKAFERKQNIVEKIRNSLTKLIESYGIEIVRGFAEFLSPEIIKSNGADYKCSSIILATGSKPNILKFEGIYEENFILTSDDILKLENLPESILIVGSGAIGIEWTRILSEAGCKVTVIEIADNIIPIADIDISNRVKRILTKNKISFFTSTSIMSINGNDITLSNGKTVTAEKILTAAGRTPEICINEYSCNLKTDKFIQTSPNFETNFENIYAIGDVNGKSMLAHSAMHQAIEVIDYIYNKKVVSFDRKVIPNVIYGSPEIAWMGKTEQELIKENIKYSKSVFPIAALGKAFADDKIEGFIKILATDNKIAGAHIISHEASAMIEQIVIASENNIPTEKLADIIFAHPTYSEGIYETVLGLKNMSIHLPPAKN